MSKEASILYHQQWHSSKPWWVAGSSRQQAQQGQAGATCIWSGRKPLTFRSSMPLSTAGTGGTQPTSCCNGCARDMLAALPLSQQAHHHASCWRRQASPRRRSIAKRSNSSIAISPSGRSAYMLSATFDRLALAAVAAAAADCGASATAAAERCRPTAPAARKVAMAGEWRSAPTSKARCPPLRSGHAAGRLRKLQKLFFNTRSRPGGWKAAKRGAILKAPSQGARCSALMRSRSGQWRELIAG